MSKIRLKRRLLLLLSSLVVGVVIAFGWREVKTPLSGGGQPDNIFARWAKSRAYAVILPAEDRAAPRLTIENANGWFGIIAEPVQSLALYQSQNPIRPTPARRTLVLQPIGAMNAEETAILRDCKTYCEAFFALPVRIAPPGFRDAAQFSPRPATVGTSKTQLNAGKLLGALKSRLPPDAAAYLGLTHDDLWTDGLAFVFGQATFQERVGVYSLARYFPKKRGPITKEQRRLALRRTVQVLTHEAGHMFGISHCVLYKCAMNGSNSLSDSDASPLDYCPVCARKLAWNIGYDRPKRDAKLRGLQASWGLK